MVYLVLCPICKDSKTYNKKPLGLTKCKACNSLFLPKPEQTGSKQFNLEFSESENEADSVNEDNVADSFTSKSTVDQKPTQDKRFLLEFSDSEDSDNEAPQETTSFTSTKEKISFGRLSESKDDEETNKLKKREASNNEEYLPSIDRKRKKAFNPLSDSEDDDQEASTNKQEKKRAFKPLSDSEYEDDGDSDDEEAEYEDDGVVLPEAEYVDNNQNLLEAERTKEQYVALFDEEEEPSENEVSTHNRHRKTVNNDIDLLSKDVKIYKQQMMDDALFSDADDAIEEKIVKKKKRVSRKKASSSGEEEVYHKGDLDKKRQKLTAVPEIKLDENGDPIKKTRGKYRFTPRPVNKFNPYILFNKEVRSKIKQANPDLDTVGINLLVGKAYRELDPEKKEKLIENSRKLVEQLKDSEVPGEEQTNTGLIKLPPNGFVLFKQNNREKYVGGSNEGMTVNNYLTELWKRLPESEKEIYRTEAKNRREEFMVNHPIMYKELMNRIKSKNLASRRLKSKKKIGV